MASCWSQIKDRISTKEVIKGTSPEVRWLRLHASASTSGGAGLIPGRV